MKKQFHKFKIAAENFSRSSKSDKTSDDLLKADKQVEKYKDVLDKISKKFSINSTFGQDQDQAAKDKRCKKVHEFKLAQAMEESLKDLPDGLLKDVLEDCAKLEKTIASEIVNNEINIENDVSKRLSTILETNITTIQKQKRIVTKLIQDNESAKHKHQAAIRLNENPVKITQLKEEQEEVEGKLEKERDIWAADMFELIAEEENISNYIINYIKFQQLYYKSALKEIERVMERFNDLMRDNNKRVFRVPLEDHLTATGREISYVIELCICCLLEKGLYEEGLLRVGCGSTKLKRLKAAIDANYIGPPLPMEYQDPHVLAGVLKLYLRDLPDPLLTYKLYNEFISAAQRPSEQQRKSAILNAVNQLPRGNYFNLRYLTKFLSYLSQKHQQNKMSSQNIAIVMSPNLLWAPNQNNTDYAEKVNSTASVNTIVELLVSDWEFFFDGTVDFYVSISRDDLFPDNAGFPYDRERDNHFTLMHNDNNMAKSMNAMIGGTTTMNCSSSGSGSTNQHYHSHSRSSSHDTSLILLGDHIKRSQSSSSLSDHSSPPQGSPKLPVRRKHNKQAAPTPPSDAKEASRPSNKMYSSANNISSTTKLKNLVEKANSDSSNSNHKPGIEIVPLTAKPLSPNKVETACQTLKSFGSNENLNKPLKPPRPILPMFETQTLNRHVGRWGTQSSRPVALPRSSLGKSPEDNNEQDSDESSMTLRQKEKNDERGNVSDGGKPVVPERPASLMRPPSYKGSLQDMAPIQFSTGSNINNNSITSNKSDNSTSTTTHGIKKTQSFRSSPSQKSTDNLLNSSLTVLERTHIYNVDKQQVAIIDVGDNGSGNNNNGSNGKPPPAPSLQSNVTNSHINTITGQMPNQLYDETPNNEINNKKIGILPKADMECALSGNEVENVNSIAHSVALLNSNKMDSLTFTLPSSLELQNSVMPNSTTVAGDSSLMTTSMTQVPPSPRGFDPKVKRPQIPAPPPPSRPKSDGSGSGIIVCTAIGGGAPGDSTNL